MGRRKCTECTAPTCPALARADTPPAGPADFFDRQSQRLMCCRGGWKLVGYYAALAIVTSGVLTALLFILGPVWTGSSMIGAGLVGTASALRHRTRKQKVA